MRVFSAGYFVKAILYPKCVWVHGGLIDLQVGELIDVFVLGLIDLQIPGLIEAAILGLIDLQILRLIDARWHWPLSIHVAVGVNIVGWSFWWRLNSYPRLVDNTAFNSCCVGSSRLPLV